MSTECYCFPVNRDAMRNLIENKEIFSFNICQEVYDIEQNSYLDPLKQELY